MLKGSQTRLQVLKPPHVEPRQNCSVCANQTNCFKPGITDRHIVTNLLTCRIKRGIQRDKSTRLLLELLKPKLMQMATEIINATGTTGLEREQILLDIQSATIEQLLHHYVMGEIGYPLHYLFGMPNGVMRRWVTSQITKTRKYNATYSSTSPYKGSPRDPSRTTDDVIDRQEYLLGETHIDDTLTHDHVKAMATKVNMVIDDGLTLRLSEYRVLRFCLDNASDAKRPLNGLHIYLGRVMGVVRSRVTRIAADSIGKVKGRAGFEWNEAEVDQ